MKRTKAPAGVVGAFFGVVQWRGVLGYDLFTGLHFGSEALVST